MKSTTPSLKMGCMSWEGVLLSIAVVAIRAFQPGSLPIESWSALSWCLMLLPAFLPFVVWTAMLAMWLVGNVISIFVKS